MICTTHSTSALRTACHAPKLCRFVSRTKMKLTRLQKCDAAINKILSIKEMKERTKKRIERPELEGIIRVIEDARDPVCTSLLSELAPYVHHNCKAKLYINQVLALTARFGSIESTLAVLRESQLSNSGRLRFSYTALEQLILSALFHRDADIAWEAGQVLYTFNRSLYTRTWALLLSIFISTEHYPAILWLRSCNLQGMEQPIFTDHALREIRTIGAMNGDQNLCRWAVLKKQRRLAFISSDTPTPQPNKLVKSYLSIIEACAGTCPDPSRHLVEGTMQGACKYLLALNHQAAHVRVHDFGTLVNSLNDPIKFAYFNDIYNSLKSDPLANESVRTLYFNLILAAYCQNAKDKPSDWLLKAQLLYAETTSLGISLNEDSLFYLIKLGYRLQNPDFIDSVLSENPKFHSRRCLVAAFLAYRDCGRQSGASAMLRELNKMNYTIFNDFDGSPGINLV